MAAPVTNGVLDLKFTHQLRLLFLNLGVNVSFGLYYSPTWILSTVGLKSNQRST
jgi:hypothetical protein